ncbi:MAG: acylphosphatase [Cytophagales bacterium]|nr:acylphosphatase [Cytophagales bacterium]
MEKLLNYHITVHGRVQGVGYRYWAQRTAESLNIKGFVKNNSDGSVFIEAEGTDDNLSKFMALCKNGSGWSHVERLDFTEYPTRGFDKFKIEY